MTSDDLDARLETVASLAEPVRRALYRYVCSQPDAITREQAATAIGVAPHVAKFHLERLLDDGLLEVDYRRPPGRSGPGAGRPAKVYHASDRQVDISLPERRYELAGRLLARAVSDAERDGTPLRTSVERAATEAGTALGEAARLGLGPRPTGRQRAAGATRVLREHGYEPRPEGGGTNLANCPFHALATDYTDLICAMNLALVQGVLTGLRVDDLAAALDPSPTRCCVRLVPSSPRPATVRE